MAEGASEKQSSLKARLRNGLSYLLTYFTVIKILILIIFFECIHTCSLQHSHCCQLIAFIAELITFKSFMAPDSITSVLVM